MAKREDLRSKLCDTLCDLIRIPSTSGQETEISDYICDAIKKEGQSFERDSYDNVVCVVGKGEKTLHVNGHMDTVVPVEGWTRDPFEPLIENDTVVGLGASDMKSGLAVMLHLLGTVRPRVRVIFSFVVCEEGSGSSGKRDGTYLVAESWPGDWAITVEASCTPTDITIGLGTQGHSKASIAVFGKAAHSSRPELGHNALMDAAQIILRVDELNKSYKPVQIYKSVFGRSSIAVTRLRAGVASNIIPDRADMLISRRTAPGETAETFEREIARITDGFVTSVEFRHGEPAAVVDLDGKLFRTAQKVCRERFGDVDYSFARGRTDLVIFRKEGMDVLNIGPGIIGEAHCPDEKVHVSNMLRTAEVLGALIEQLE